MTKVAEMVDKLPPELQEKVAEYVESLRREEPQKPTQKLKLDWRGALNHLREEYTSVELKHH